MGNYFPMMVKLHGIKCLVVGGGLVAERKIAALLEAGAAVKVVSPAFTLNIEQWHDEGKIEAISKRYSTGDGEDALLVIAATNDPAVNAQVVQDMQGKTPWIDVVDRSELSTFTMPAVVRRGKLVIAVSTSGASPSIASRIRSEIEAIYGVEYELVLELLSEYRMNVQQNVKDAKERHLLLKEAAVLDGLTMIREGRADEYRQMLNNKLRVRQIDGGS